MVHTLNRRLKYPHPLTLLHSLSKERLNELSSDKGFISELEAVWEQFQNYLQYAGIFKDEYNFEKDNAIAYSSMEFGLHESIHTYAGYSMVFRTSIEQNGWIRQPKPERPNKVGKRNHGRICIQR